LQVTNVVVIAHCGISHKAVNDLRDKARRAFYAIKRNIQFNIPIRIWLKILESVIEPIALFGCEVWGPLSNQVFTKWKKHQIETLHAELCKNILCVQCRIRPIPTNYQNPEKSR
jgi:hypothetical protein